MNDRSTLLLEHHLKELKLPSFLREYGKMAAQCAAENVGHPEYLLRLAELELIDRHKRLCCAKQVVDRNVNLEECASQDHGCDGQYGDCLGLAFEVVVLEFASASAVSHRGFAFLLERTVRQVTKKKARPRANGMVNSGNISFWKAICIGPQMQRAMPISR